MAVTVTYATIDDIAREEGVTVANIAKKTTYWNEDKTELVGEGDEQARTLFTREGSPIDDDEAARAGFTDFEAEEPLMVGDPHNIPWSATVPLDVPGVDNRSNEAKAVSRAPENKALTQGPNATDAARKLAEDEGVDLAGIEGTGADGRITVEDVRGAAGRAAE